MSIIFDGHYRVKHRTWLLEVLRLHFEEKLPCIEAGRRLGILKTTQRVPDQRHAGRINSSGLGKTGFAGQGMDNPWQMKRERLSPRYTTCLGELPVVK